ncbi:MAG: sigma-70 family RNA polymerase sigma factor [Myxococcota bacterium]|nr:sigma-70 family RNA polymerase sigma factor [Myxococcota bacterium]
MGLSNDQYPRDLRRAIAHAQRLMKILSEIERAQQDVWFRGRAEEVRGAVSLAIADWRSGARDADGVGKLLLSYVDSLHRSASKKLRCGLALACCDQDDVITAVAPDEWRSTTTGVTTGVAMSQGTGEPTVPGQWVDSPEMLARFQEGLPLVEVHARAIVRRLGAGFTLDDLRALGREGLLDATRSFSENRGVPFERWASLRVRNAMIDGVRRWGAIPFRARKRLQASPQELARKEHAEGQSQGRDSVDRVQSPRSAALEDHEAMASLGDGVGGLGLTPEDALAKAELASLVRTIVADLPSVERALIERSYFSGLTLAQAAASIGVSRSWAHRVHARAIETIQRELSRRDGVAARRGR